jgi:hypothetical protein
MTRSMCSPLGVAAGRWTLPRAVRTLVKRHPAGEYTLGNCLPQDARFGRSQTPKTRGRRQPAQEFRHFSAGWGGMVCPKSADWFY